MTNRPVFVAQAGRVVKQGFAAFEPGENILNDGLVNIQARDMLAHVFIAGLAKKIAFGLIRP